MAGIYIHIPFCKTRCSYCSFHSSIDISKKDRYVDALCKEIVIRKDYLHNEPIKTIYVGGGTPSQLSASHLSQIFSTLASVYDIQDVEECTLECNPDDINNDFLQSIATLPINRISMGVQSFNDKELRGVCRRHKSQQALDAIELCKKYYNNISIDLIMGLPWQTVESYTESLHRAIACQVEHISVYALSYEEGTPLWTQRENKIISPMDEDKILEEITITRELLGDALFEQYEISNYAKIGCHSRHNSSYWNRSHYVGYGSGAHSFYGNERRWNVADIDAYCNAIEQGALNFEKETLSATDIYNEIVMLGLRTKKGINLEQLTPDEREQLIEAAQCFIQDEFLELRDNSLIITTKGIDIADYITRQLFKE